MHLEAKIVKFRDALGGCNRKSLEIHLEAVIERVWRLEYLEEVDRRGVGCGDSIH